MTSPSDTGLQPERTSLAWRRTAMSVLVGSLALAKLLANDLPVAGVVLAAVGIIWTVDLALTAKRRYSQGVSALVSVADRGPGHRRGTNHGRGRPGRCRHAEPCRCSPAAVN